MERPRKQKLSRQLGEKKDAALLFQLHRAGTFDSIFVTMKVSHFDKLDLKVQLNVLKYLKLEERVKLERINKMWQMQLLPCLWKKQTAIHFVGVKNVNLLRGCACLDESHQLRHADELIVGESKGELRFGDTIKVLVKCTELRALYWSATINFGFGELLLYGRLKLNKLEHLEHLSLVNKIDLEILEGFLEVSSRLKCLAFSSDCIAHFDKERLITFLRRSIKLESFSWQVRVEDLNLADLKRMFYGKDMKQVNFHPISSEMDDFNQCLNAFKNLQSATLNGPFVKYGRTQLKALRCIEIKLEDAKTANQLIDALKKNAFSEKLKTLHLKTSSIGKKTIGELVKSIAMKCTKLQEIVLCFESFSLPVQLSQLAGCQQLRTLRILSCEIPVFPRVKEFDDAVKLVLTGFGKIRSIEMACCVYVESKLFESLLELVLKKPNRSVQLVCFEVGGNVNNNMEVPPNLTMIYKPF